MWLEHNLSLSKLASMPRPSCSQQTCFAALWRHNAACYPDTMPAACLRVGLPQERASLQQSQLPAFLSGQVALEELLGPNSKKLGLMRQVQQSLVEAQQVSSERPDALGWTCSVEGAA